MYDAERQTRLASSTAGCSESRDSRKADWPLGEDVDRIWATASGLCPPKTDSGERIVVLDDVMCGALDEEPLAVRRQKGVDSPMLFVTGRGTPIDRRIEYFHWDKALLRIGIVNGEDGVRLQAALREAHGGHALRQRRRAGERPARADGPQRRRDGRRVPARGHRGFAEGQRGRAPVRWQADRLVLIYKGPARRSTGRSLLCIAYPPVTSASAGRPAGSPPTRPDRCGGCAWSWSPRSRRGVSPFSTAALTTLAGMPESAPASGTVRVQFVAQRRLLDMACHALACASQGIRQK